MKLHPYSKYFLSCFLLTFPVLVWNIFLTKKFPEAFQPEIFWNRIPPILFYGENIFRAIVFALTLFMPLHISKPSLKKGFILYFIGIILYFSSWLLLIYYPNSSWSDSLPGLMAPAYTPLFWLTGIGLIGDTFYFNLPFKKWLFILTSILFLIFHNLHAYIVFQRLH